MADSKLHEQFLANGGRDIIVQAKIEDPAECFKTAEELVQFITTAKQKVGQVDSVQDILNGILTAHGSKRADAGPVGPNEKPRMLKISAFIAHGGSKPNRNRDGFVDEDLQARVNEGLFGAPYFGMIDFNHDFTAYGAWYSSQFAFDPDAGTNGILAEGAIFAWRYSDLADKMLAEQQRKGYIDVSMGCIPGSIERKRADDGLPFDLIRNPIFMTTSLLTVPPGDAKARGYATEDPKEMPGLQTPLLQKTAEMESQPHLSNVDTITLEDDMTVEDLIKSLREAVAQENRESFDKLVESALKVPELQQRVTTLAADMEATKAENTALKTAVADKDTKIAELTTIKESQESKMTEQATELETLRTFKADADKKEADAVKKAKWEARLAELNENAKKAFEAREETVRASLQEKWTNYEQAEWEILRDSLNAAKFETSNQYETASKKEGLLAGAGDAGAPSKDKIDAFIKKR